MMVAKWRDQRDSCGSLDQVLIESVGGKAQLLVGGQDQLLII